MEDDPRISFFTKSAPPYIPPNSFRIRFRFELYSKTPPALLDSCYYNLFHGTSNLIMGPIFTIYFLKFAQFICFFMSKYPDMMNPIIIISVFYLVSPL